MQCARNEHRGAFNVQNVGCTQGRWPVIAKKNRFIRRGSQIAVVSFMKLNPTLRRTLLAAAFGSWLLACGVPALHFNNMGDHAVSGFELMTTGLFFGWVVVNFAAYANPFLLIAGIQCLRGKQKSARILSVISLFLAAQTLQLILFPCTWPSAIGSTSRSAACRDWARPDVELFLWVASVALVFLATGRAEGSEIEEQPVVITLFDKA